VSVSDTNPRFPMPAPLAAASASNGRGLPILRVLADQWGGYLLGDLSVCPDGKTIWFELHLAAGPRPPEAPVLAA
jgi:hypothetical protein